LHAAFRRAARRRAGEPRSHSPRPRWTGGARVAPRPLDCSGLVRSARSPRLVTWSPTGAPPGSGKSALFVLARAHSRSIRCGQTCQLVAHVPQPSRIGRVIAALGRSRGLALGEEAARHLLEIGSGGHVDRRGGTSIRAQHERPQGGDEQSLNAAGVLGPEGCADHAGVQSVGCHRGGAQPLSQFVSEQDVGELGLVVGAGAGVGARALKVVEVRPMACALDETVTTRARPRRLSRGYRRRVRPARRHRPPAGPGRRPTQMGVPSPGGTGESVWCVVRTPIP
jgi:hypothetical protein